MDKEEMTRRISYLENRIEWLGQIAKICVSDDINRVCSYCRCPKGKTKETNNEHD